MALVGVLEAHYSVGARRDADANARANGSDAKANGRDGWRRNAKIALCPAAGRFCTQAGNARFGRKIAGTGRFARSWWIQPVWEEEVKWANGE